MKGDCSLKKEQQGSEHCDECGARHFCDEVVLTSTSEPLLDSFSDIRERVKSIKKEITFDDKGLSSST